MKADELADYILQHMDAETALRTLLKNQTIQYAKMKLGAPIDPGPGDSISPLHIIMCACMDMGWEIAIESDQEQVRGLTIGTKEYMEKTLGPLKTKPTNPDAEQTKQTGKEEIKET